MSAKVASVTSGSSSGENLMDIPSDVAILAVRFLVQTAWDGSAPTVLVGINGDSDKFLGSGEVDLTTIGEYVDSSRHILTNDAQLRCVFDQDSSAAGQGYIIVEYQSLS